jgi:hypothetical protein
VRSDGLRIDPKARPYGMHWFDLVVELIQGLPVELDRQPSPHGRRLLDAMGVQYRVRG